MSDSVKVISLLDEMEDIIATARRVPFTTDQAIVDANELNSIIDDIRMSLPKDIQQAQWVSAEQERILSQAKEEYDKVIIQAKKQAEYLVENDAIKKEAEKRAAALINEAENHSRYLKLRTYEYVDKMLYDMQVNTAQIATDFLEPMSTFFTDSLRSMNDKINDNRQEMKSMAARIQEGAIESSNNEE